MTSPSRALDDPVKLLRAAQIIRIALERKGLTLAGLAAEPDPGIGDRPA